MSETRVDETKPSETKPSETKPSETKPKKTVSRNFSIALGIICILVVGLIGLVAVLNLQNQVSDLTNTLNLGKSTYWVNYHQKISQPAGSYTSLIFSPKYAGYITVSVDESDSYNTYARVIYSADVYTMNTDYPHSVNYDNQTDFHINGTILTSGAADFPVLPASIEIRVGNTNTVGVGGWESPVGNVTEWVTIIYYY